MIGMLLASVLVMGIAQPSSVPTEKALLWKISGQELAAPSYLYGTIHMINKEDFFLNNATRSAIETAQTVTFEINMDEMDDMSALMPLLMQAFMVGDTTLSDLLTEEEYQLVAGHFSKMGLPMAFLDRIKPMFLSAMGGEGMMAAQQQGSLVSYEMEILKLAKSQGKSIGGLETAAYQMSMFDSIPYQVQARMLVETIQSEGGSDEQFERMVKMYKEQDIQGMQSLIQSEGGELAEYENLLLVNRNRNWIPVMSEMMQGGPTFFAVGAGHLGGDQGVVALLREAGYDVEPVQ